MIYIKLKWTHEINKIYLNRILWLYIFNNAHQCTKGSRYQGQYIWGIPSFYFLKKKTLCLVLEMFAKIRFRWTKFQAVLQVLFFFVSAFFFLAIQLNNAVWLCKWRDGWAKKKMFEFHFGIFFTFIWQSYLVIA